jgi:Tfp pilus assembly protein PilO
MIDRLNKFKAIIMKQQEKLDKKKITLIALLGIVMLSLDFTFVINLQLKGIKNNGRKITTIKKDIATLKDDLARMLVFKGSQGGIVSPKKIINEKEITILLEEISDTANKNNIRITNIKPSKIRDEKASTDLASITLTLDIYCEYHNLGKFINDLENSRVFMAVEELKIIPDPKDNFRQSANLAVKVYVKK